MEFSDKINTLRRIPRPANGSNKPDLLSLAKNTVIKVEGELFLVDEILEYEELDKKGSGTGFVWKEYGLVNLTTFEKRYLEVEDDDGIHIYVTDDKVVSGRLSTIPNENTKEISVKNLAGEQPFYLDEWTRVLMKNREKELDEQFKALDFESDDESVLLGVEVHDDGNCSAHTYHEVERNNVEIVAYENL